MENKEQSKPLMFIENINTEDIKSSNQQEYDSRFVYKTYQTNPIFKYVYALTKAQKLGFEFELKVTKKDDSFVSGKLNSFEKNIIFVDKQEVCLDDIFRLDIIKTDFI